MKRSILLISLFLFSIICFAQRPVGRSTTPARGPRSEHFQSPRGSMPVRVLGDKEFRNLMRNVEEATFYSNKEREVLLGMSYGMFTSYQCKQLLKCFTFSDDKVKFLTLVYTNVVDKELFFVAVRQLSFSSDQDKVFDYIEHYHKKR